MRKEGTLNFFAGLRERSEYSPTRRGQTSRGTPFFPTFKPTILA